MGENLVEVRRFGGEVKNVARSRGGPAGAGRVESHVSEIAVNESAEHLVGGHQGAVGVGENDGDVLSVSSNTLPGGSLRALVSPSLALVGAEDGVTENGGCAGKDDGGETHFERGMGGVKE